MQLIRYFLFTGFVFLMQAYAAYGQLPMSKWRILFDFTAIQLNLGEIVTENVSYPPFLYDHRNKPGLSAEVSLLRNLRSWAWGIGISTNSVRQKFKHIYSLPAQGGIDEQQEIQLDLYRHYVGPHVFIQLKQPDLEIGLRLGVYYPFAQNECTDEIDRQFAVNNSKLGTRRAQLNTRCSAAEQALTKALTEFEFMHRIYKQFWGGINFTYFGWRNNERGEFFQFYLKEDLQWTDGSNAAPVVNDITVFEPQFQIGLNLRYDFQWK